MLMIRFQRIGRKNDPAFRIAVLEKASGPKAGKYVDLVGTYNPKTKESSLKPELIKEWVAKGAQVSPSVMNLLIAKGVYEGKKIQVISKKNLEKNKPAEVVAPPEAPAAEVVAEETVVAEEAVAPTEEEVVAEAAETEEMVPEVAAAEEEVPAEAAA